MKTAKIQKHQKKTLYTSKVLNCANQKTGIKSKFSTFAGFLHVRRGKGCFNSPMGKKFLFIVGYMYRFVKGVARKSDFLKVYTQKCKVKK